MRRPGPSAGHLRHVIWIVFENQSLGHVIGNRALPFTNRLAARCGLATRFFAEAHPSLPNYLAMTSGGTQGVTGDSSGPLAADNIYAQVRRSGRQWRHYAFGMPSRLRPARRARARIRAIYTAHHQPPMFYRSIARGLPRWDVGVGDPSKVEDFSDVRCGPLADALRRNRLPAFATLGPTDDGGNSAAGGEVDPVKGDAFLARWIPRITASRAYRGGRTAIFITWDEPDDFGGRPQRDRSRRSSSRRRSGPADGSPRAWTTTRCSARPRTCSACAATSAPPRTPRPCGARSASRHGGPSPAGPRDTSVDSSRGDARPRRIAKSSPLRTALRLGSVACRRGGPRP